MQAVLESLIAAAIWAPSGDNTQPWHFVADASAGKIHIELDPTRDPSPMNAGQRMARIALGAAVENIVRAAATLGAASTIQIAESGNRVDLELADLPAEASPVAPGLLSRTTNRRFYDGRSLPGETVAQLVAAVGPLESVRAHWICESNRLSELARFIGRSDTMLFSSEPMREAFLENVRFDAPADEAVEEGLSIASLEMKGLQASMFKLLPRLPDWLFRTAKIAASIGAHSRKLMASASGACLITAPDEMPKTDIHVGRAMQQAWLAIGELGMVAQPMMSLMVMENALAHASEQVPRGKREAQVAQLAREFKELLPAEVGDDRAAFLLRFGFADPPTGRTGRRPMDSVTDEIG